MAESQGRIKNKAPASIQITAEQLLREAADFQLSGSAAKPRQRVEDYEELQEYQGRKRQEFEETIRRTRWNIQAWAKYANWEASQGEFARARSVFERALDVESTALKLWLSYIEMELKARNVQHARNLYDRCVTLLPRVDQVWYKYVYLEELLGNVAGCRQVFERWMSWEPDEKAWNAYIKLEMRYGELERASTLHERLCNCHPEPRNFVKWARFEESDRHDVARAREVYTLAFEFFGQDSEDAIAASQSIYTNFAKLEVRQKEYERARVIFKFALERLPRHRASQLYASYTNFEKQHGTRSSVEHTVAGKRRLQYEDELELAPDNYDAWFDYARLEEDAFRGALPGSDDQLKARERARDVYERAVARVPPSQEKRHWRRYIFTWLQYALFEEIDTKDVERARDVYEAAVKVVPHKLFTFAKLWRQYADFLLRRMDVAGARKAMGAAIGMAPKEKIFKDYIEMELRLREFDRCRTLYEKWLEAQPTNPTAWIKFAELEKLLSDHERVRAIFELAVEQPGVDMPELLWKAYIDFEYAEGEFERTRALYERLLERTSHVKVWCSFAQFEFNAGNALADVYMGIDADDDEDDEGERGERPEPDEAAATQARAEGLERAAGVLKRAYDDMRAKQLKEERVVVLETWKSLAAQAHDSAMLDKVQAMLPRVVKRMRKVDGDATIMEEYYDLVFPDDEAESTKTSARFLQLAHAWKQKQAAQQQQQQAS